MARAFVIRPFGKKKDTGGKEFDFEKIHQKLIAPALEGTELSGSTTGELIESGNIREDMFALILEADLVICDITIHNANVFYELGIRHALRKRSTILLKGEGSADSTPFDVMTDRYLSYNPSNPDAAKDDLIKTIGATLNSSRDTDSPIFKLLPALAETNPSTIQIVPVDFQEEVERANSANSKGWLRLLSSEVRDQRFLWSGLRIVAQAQWSLQDFEGARKSYELITDTYPDNIESNLALANIYERLSKDAKNPKLLTSSDLAIDRVINNGNATSQNRIEAYALRGRNLKTRWRNNFMSSENIEKRRSVAMNHELCNSYNAYWEAFEQDLNHFYSGLNALQMGSIFLDLAATNKTWRDIFPSDDEADSYFRKLEKNVDSLRTIIPIVIDAAQKQLETNHQNQVWAAISEADFMFLTSNSESRIFRAYEQAIPDDMPFIWDAAKNQLQLFVDLGIKSELAINTISNIDAQFGEPELKDAKPLHVIIFAGHRTDEPDREIPRFPEASVEKARKQIQAELEALKDPDTRLIGFASAAPGADILFHEICLELGIPSTICLPIPKDAFGSICFEDYRNWHSRYLELLPKLPTLELSHEEGLPRWLNDSGANPWERGNRWVLQMALTSDADRITQLALWDGKERGNVRGGTAHVVELAHETGKVHVRIIDSKQLLL